MVIEQPVALITGGTKGIGRATALELARRGVHVAVVGRNHSAGNTAVADMVASGGSGAFLAADLSRMMDVRRLAGEVLARYKRLDILIHSADLLRIRREESSEELEISFATNYLSRFLLNTLLLELLKASTPARILHVAAAGFPGKLNLAQVPPGPKSSSFAGSGVTINILNPGLVDTDIRRNAPDGKLLMWLMERMFRSSVSTPKAFQLVIFRPRSKTCTASKSQRRPSAQ